METKHSGALPCLLFLALIFFSAQAQAAIDSAGVLDNILSRYHTAASAWQTVITQRASWLFWLLVVISMVWTFGLMALRRADIGEFFAEFVRFTVFTGFFWWLLINGPAFATSIIASLKQIGSEASGLRGMGSPSSIVDIGFEIFYRAIGQSIVRAAVDSMAGIYHGNHHFDHSGAHQRQYGHFADFRLDTGVRRHILPGFRGFALDLRDSHQLLPHGTGGRDIAVRHGIAGGHRQDVSRRLLFADERWPQSEGNGRPAGSLSSAAYPGQQDPTYAERHCRWRGRGDRQFGCGSRGRHGGNRGRSGDRHDDGLGRPCGGRGFCDQGRFRCGPWQHGRRHGAVRGQGRGARQIFLWRGAWGRWWIPGRVLPEKWPPIWAVA